jgi:hypothetical protein
MKKVKRAPIAAATLREIYLRSGNRCAFPGCSHALVNAEGAFIAQVCHIEAAMPGGERFNPDQTNKQRAAASNLLLLCYEHHVETNDVEMYTVDGMRRIKTEHERVFSDIVGSMLRTVVDHTTLSQPAKATKLASINSVLGWNQCNEELEPLIEELDVLAAKLSQVPQQSRSLLAILVKRSQKSPVGDYEVALVPDVMNAASLNMREMRNLNSSLDMFNFTFDDGNTDFGVEAIGLSTLPDSGWNFWRDLKRYCRKRKLPIEALIINLDFSILD